MYYTADALSRMFCDGEAGHVAGYSCPEADAVRYKQSYACRINLVRGESVARVCPRASSTSEWCCATCRTP